MTLKAIFAAALLGMACGLAAAADDMEEAMISYERGSYVDAEVKLLHAARAGDAQAQEMLGLMYAMGPGFYPGVAQNRAAAAQWFDRAARSGRPVARYLHCAISRADVPPRTQRRSFCFDRIAATGEPPARR